MHVLSNCFLTRHLSSPFTNCPDYTPPTWPLPNAMTSSPTTLPLTSPIPATMDFFLLFQLAKTLARAVVFALTPPPSCPILAWMVSFYFSDPSLNIFTGPQFRSSPLWSPIASPYFNSLQCTQLLSSLDILLFVCLLSSLFTICLPY